METGVGQGLSGPGGGPASSMQLANQGEAPEGGKALVSGLRALDVLLDPETRPGMSLTSVTAS